MPHPHRPDIDVRQLHRFLKTAIRHGARAARLVEHLPEIVELLYPAARWPHLSQHERALNVEADIRRAVDEDIGGAPGEAVATVLCLRSGTVGRTLEDRRRVAADFLDLEAGTFRRDRHESALLRDVATEMLRYAITQRESSDMP
jgi:hypothetical protein